MGNEQKHGIIDAGKAASETRSDKLLGRMRRSLSTKLLAPVLAAGSLTLAFANLNCGDGTKQQDAGACTEVITDAGEKECQPTFSCAYDVNNVCNPRVAQTDGPVSEGGTEGDGGTPVPDGGVMCFPDMKDNAQVNVSKNVKLQGTQCGQNSCEGTVGVGEDVEFVRGDTVTKYPVTSITDTALEAVKDTTTVVATKATAGGKAACTVYESGVQKGACIDELGGNVEFVANEQQDANALGRGTILMAAVGATSKTAMVTEGEAAKIATLGTDLTVELTLNRGSDGKVYIKGKVSNSETSDVREEPLGLAMSEGVTRVLGDVSLTLLSGSDNVSPCNEVVATLIIDGDVNEVHDGMTVKANGKDYKVVVQVKTDEFGGVLSEMTNVSLLDTSAEKNGDHVVPVGDTKTVNGVSVTVVSVQMTSDQTTETPDAGL